MTPTNNEKQEVALAVHERCCSCRHMGSSDNRTPHPSCGQPYAVSANPDDYQCIANLWGLSLFGIAHADPAAIATGCYDMALEMLDENRIYESPSCHKFERAQA